MILESRSRGQPLLALVLIVGGWIGARALAWDHALEREQAILRAQAAPSPALLSAPRRALTTATTANAGELTSAPGGPLRPLLPQVDLAPAPSWLASLPPAPTGPLPPDPALSTTGQRIAAVGGHHALWLAATALMPLPPLGLRELDRTAAAVPARRWSADGWLLLRPNPDGIITPGPLPGTYGASQAGAVVRYRLDTTSLHKPALYARAAAAIGKGARA